MKFLKLSLAASVALGAFSTASFAQPLEEAIRGIDVSGYLRYRYNDDRYDGNGFNKDSVANSNATHRWKAVADFKTPVVNNIALNFGILYNNESNNVNHGNGVANGNTPTIPNPSYNPKDPTSIPTIPNPSYNPAMPSTIPGVGLGLGSGKDGSFGVSVFNAVITPDSTATTVILGKQRLATPVTNAGDDDRGTGILALNSDLEGFTFAAGAFDSWSIDDVHQGYTSGGNDGVSVTKPLYVLAGIYGVDTAYGRFGGQLWGFYIQDAVDALGVGELTWDGSTFNAALQYAIAKLDNSDSSVLGALHGYANIDKRTGLYNKSNITEANDLFVFNVGADFAQDFGVPLDVKLGYVTNFQDGTAVTLNDDGTIFKYAGAIWWQNNATGVSTSALLNRGVHGFGSEQDLSVFYGAIGYRMVDERLRIGLDYVWGSNDVSYKGANGFGSKRDVDFQEITPRFSWKHNANLTISGYYAYLMTDRPDLGSPAPAGAYDNVTDEDRQRVRLEVKYSF
ncbi:major outer membrane protein [Helicobacter rodentium]|uniref:major outer membrane protein n=1 Tax=Helicobacter rodentium TaxID=59617 RepID=UPI0004787DA7|nr:major outer membrane protein [Helicobacter rodentium]